MMRALAILFLPGAVAQTEYSGFFLLDEPANFTQCEARCNEVGASLACIRSEDEYRRISKRNPGEEFWIGLYRRGPCSWEWTSGCGSEYEAWRKGMPRVRGNECAAMDSSDEGYQEGVGTWWSDNCGRQLPCLCEAGRAATPKFLAWDGWTHDYDRPRHLALSVLAGLCAAIVVVLTGIQLHANLAGDAARALQNVAATSFLLTIGLMLHASRAGVRLGDTCPAGLHTAGRVFDTLAGLTLSKYLAGRAQQKYRAARAKAEAEQRARDRKLKIHEGRAVAADEGDVAVDIHEYVAHVAEEHRTVEDAITGNSLDMDSQTILIGVDTSGAKAPGFVTWRLWPWAVMMLYPLACIGLEYGIVVDIIADGGNFSLIILFLLIAAVFGPIILWVLHSKLAKILLVGGGDRAAWKQIVDPLQVRCRAAAPSLV